MLRSELIQTLSLRFHEIRTEDCEYCCRLMLEEMIGVLANGGRIEVRGFGSFSIATHPERNGRNPKTGEKVTIPSKRVIRFKQGKELFKRINLLK